MISYFDVLVGLPELLAFLHLSTSGENGERRGLSRDETILFSIEEYISFLRREVNCGDFPIIDRKNGIVLSHPLAHTFFPAMLILVYRIIDSESDLPSLRGRDFFYWHDEISSIRQYPLSADIYPRWRSLTEEFLRGGYYIHHGDFNDPVCVFSDERDMDAIDKEIFRRLGVQEFVPCIPSPRRAGR